MWRSAGLLAAALVAGSCAAPAPGPSPSPPAAGGTVWLCRPGLSDDPCAASLDVTVVTASGATAIRHDVADPASAFDCFYVYPTVSRQRATNADLTVDPEERAVAIAQASRFSQVCRVWAPMYRQRTLASLARGLNADPSSELVAYESLRSAWRDYLDRENAGRPVIFIGHSQGAAMLIALLRREIDGDDAVRGRMVSAILLGGNVAVPAGRDVGATFQNIPACRAPEQTRCVIAYSSYGHEPPPNSVFARPGLGVSARSGQSPNGLQILCVDPAALGGGTAALDAYFGGSRAFRGSTVSTPWVEYPDLYTGTCVSSGGATWLQVTDAGPPGDTRPRVVEAQGPSWGYHGDDVNLALGNLVRDVARQEAAYLATGR